MTGVTFEVDPESYDRFMGRYSQPLALQFVEELGVRAGQRALDVGCGPGALTVPLVDRLGADSVTAVDPSESFVAAMQDRFPDVDVRPASAEQLPFDDDTFDLVLAQLVVHFMTDALAGIAEMARVTRAGGVIAASVWDHASGRGPLTPFWRAAIDLDPAVQGEAALPGTAVGQLEEMFATAGLGGIKSSLLTITVPFVTFEEWWEPMTLGVGPAGDYVARLDDSQRAALRDRCVQHLPQAPFEVRVSARCVSGRP